MKERTMEHRVTYMVAELGFDSDNGERVLDAFLAIAPEVGPVVSQNVVHLVTRSSDSARPPPSPRTAPPGGGP